MISEKPLLEYSFQKLLRLQQLLPKINPFVVNGITEILDGANVYTDRNALISTMVAFNLRYPRFSVSGAIIPCETLRRKLSFRGHILDVSKKLTTNIYLQKRLESSEITKNEQLLLYNSK